MSRLNNVLQTIGNTPVVRLNALTPANVNLYAKLEYFNPMGSVKDRMALAMIEHAEKTGALKPGQGVVEATSGNTGIGLAMVCAQKGYPLVVTMIESASLERRKLLRFLGAKVVLTPASEKGTGMMRKAEELARAHGYFLTRQFCNEINADVHSRTTAQEILADFADVTLDYWVSGFGTGGTVKGVARVLKMQSPHTRVLVAEPDNAQLLGSAIRQVRNGSGEPGASHPNFRPHLMQGWTPDFISTLMESAMQEGWVDATIAVDGHSALKCARDLARKEGIFAGITAGATVAAGLKIAKQAKPGANILCMVPDTGERYLSTPLFDAIQDDMNEEELYLSESTPVCRFSVAAEPLNQPGAIAMDTLDRATLKIVNDIIDGDAVVLFALEWCEFSWAAEKLCKTLKIPYRRIELDSSALREDDLGGKIRQVLSSISGSATIPQVFVGGEYIGGNTELFNAYKLGSLHKRLRKLNIDLNSEVKFNPQSLLPNWLQSRNSG